MTRLFVSFCAVVSVALCLIPAGAHLFEMPNKLPLAPADYMTVQKIYAAWSFFAIAIGLALIATLAHVWQARGDRTALILSGAAFLGIAATQVIFWSYTFPMNAASQSWTVMPEPFEAARRQWEYSHAVNALITFASLISITLAALILHSEDQLRT
jgi:hypothetical protein